MPASEPDSYAAACGACLGGDPRRSRLLLVVVVASSEERHPVSYSLSRRSSACRVDLARAGLVGQRLAERGEPGVGLERFRFQDDAARQPRAARLDARALGDELKPLIAGVDRDLVDALGTEHPVAPALDAHRAGHGLLQLDGQRLDERAQVERVGAQRRRQQVDVKPSVVGGHEE